MKKVLSVVLVLALVLMFVPVAASAASTAKIGFESKEAKAGGTVELELKLNNNPGISGLVVSVAYDETALTLSEVRKGNLFSGFTSGKNYVWDESENVVADGILATFVFTVSDEAAAADYNIEVIVRSCVDSDLNDVACDVGSGIISVACSHSLREVSAKPATCDNDGSNALWICDLCGKIFKADGITETTMEAERIPALGHDMASATCTNPAICKRIGCGYTEGAALGHNYKAAWEQGANGHWHNCAVCNEPGKVEPHAPGAAATEQTAQICTVCSYVLTPALGHTHSTSKVEGVSATCTEAGQKDYYICVCGMWFEDAEASREIKDHKSVVVNALGHDMGEASCTEPATCQREGCQHTQGNALGHTWVDASCQTPKTCERCGLTEGEALAHVESPWQSDAQNHWKVCQLCNSELEGSKLAHEDADADGKCDICGYIPNTEDEENPSTGDFRMPWMLGMAMVLSATLVLAMASFDRKKSTK